MKKLHFVKPAVIVVAGLCWAGLVAAQATVDIGSVTQEYKNAADLAWDVVLPFARSLFLILATIQVAWAAIMLALEKSDLQGWVVGLVRQVFFIGLGWAILENAKDWMWAIFRSFAQLGTSVSPRALQPGDIFGTGIDMAIKLSNTSVGLNIPLGIALLIASVIIAIVFSFMAVTLLIALIEGTIAVVLGQILLGFAGSKWTIGYTEKYIGMIVNVGLKVFTTYFMAGIAMVIVDRWVAATTNYRNMGPVSELIGGSIILAVLVWGIPKFVSLVIGGAPSLGFSDAAGVVAGMATAVGTVAGGAIAGGLKAGSAASGAVGAMRGNSMTGAAAGVAGGTSGGSSYAGTDGMSVPPPSTIGNFGAGSAFGGPGSSGTPRGGGAGSAGGTPPLQSQSLQGATTAERSNAGGEQRPPTRDDSGADLGQRGQNDLVSAAAQGVAAQAGMSRFVPSSVGASASRGPGTGAPDAGVAGAGMPPPIVPGAAIGTGAVPPPVGGGSGGPSGSDNAAGSTSTPTEALGSRGGAEIAGNAPQGISAFGGDPAPSSPAGITTSSPMAMPGASNTPGMTPGSSSGTPDGGGFAGGMSASSPIPSAPISATGEQTGMAAAATIASAGAAIGSAGMTVPPPPPPPAPAPQPREQLPSVHDDYERMDSANRRNRLTLDQPRNPDHPGLRGPSRPKP